MEERIMLKNVIKISIRLFIIFWIFQFLTMFTTSWNHLVNLYGIKIDMSGVYFNNVLDGIAMDKQDIFKIFLQFIITWCLNIAVIVILWIKSEKVAKTIIGKNDIENIQITPLDSESILSIGLCIICVYFFIDSVTRLLYYISDYIISFTQIINKGAEIYFSSGTLFSFLELLLKLIISIIGIRYREKIVKKLIVKNDKNKSNGI
jgi:hypothetical protein